jgi:hypothetical protein
MTKRALLVLLLATTTSCATTAPKAAPKTPKTTAGAQALPPAAFLLYDSASKGDYETVRNLLNDDPSLAKLRFAGGRDRAPCGGAERRSAYRPCADR